MILTTIISLCSGLSVGCAIWAILSIVKNMQIERNSSTNTLKSMPLLFKILMPFLPVIRPFLNSSLFLSSKKILAIKLAMAGLDEQISPKDYLGIKILSVILGIFLMIIGLFHGYFIIWLTLAILIMIYPITWLSATIKKRHLAIMKALPNILDLLTLSVESGKDLLSSMRDILSRRKSDPLSEELMRTFQEIQLGRKRSDAFKALSDRVRQSDLTSTINAIIISEELGVSIGKQLRAQGDAQRNKRFMLAEKLANESAVKIIFPVVIFILPAVFIILFGPILVQAARSFL